MTTPIQHLESYKIPTTSQPKAIRHISELELTGTVFRNRIAELTGTTVDLSDKQAEFTYKYMVQNIISRTANDKVLDMSDIYVASSKQASNFIGQNQHVLIEKESTYKPKVNSDGTKKPKKGSKKILAIQVYNDNKDKNLSRKEFIALLVKDVDLTPAGASTYYSNLKSEKWS